MRLRGLLPAVTALTLICGADVFADPIVVSCRPGERAVVRSAYVRGQSVTRVHCGGSASGYRQAYRPASYRTQYETRRYVRPRRSWGKSALVIGGSAATGAGIGGIISGGKGALVGGALGGGVGSLYESAKRR
jgi:hypothetical protein